MTLRLSTKLCNNLAGPTGFAATFANGVIDVYTGTQPSSADSAATGTLLGTITQASGAWTAETLASQTITVAGSAGSINTVVVGTLNIIPLGAVAFTVDAATTAAALAAAINRNGLYAATVSGTVVTVKAPAGTGAAHNGVAFATTVTTLTATVGAATLSGGVDAVNGLTFNEASGKSVTKSGTWSFVGIADGTAGWWRMRASPADAGGADTTFIYPRLDGSCGVGSGDMSLSNVVIAVSAPTTVDAFTWTQPAS